MKPSRRAKKESRQKDLTETNKKKYGLPAQSETTADKSEKPKDIFVDIEPDSKTCLVVKDQSKEMTTQQVQSKQTGTTVQPQQPHFADAGENIALESQPLLNSISIDIGQPIQAVDQLQVDMTTTSSTETSQSIDVSTMPETLTKLNTANGSEVYLIGTAHFSTKSVDDVERVIRTIRPSAVVLELCQERAFMLQLDEESLLQQNKSLSMQKVRDAIAEKGVAQGLIYIMFVKMSASITEKLGMAPGSEFRAGSREATKIPGCNVVLGDRSLRVTIARAVASISLWQKIKLIYQFVKNDIAITEEDVEKCKEKDMLEQLLEEFAGEFPGFKTTLLDERNIYLAHSIYNYAQNSETSMGPQKIVAIVGIGHVAGIVDNWGQTTDDEVELLKQMPKKSKTGIVVKKTIKYCSIIFLVYVGYRAFMPSTVQESISTKLFNRR